MDVSVRLAMLVAAFTPVVLAQAEPSPARQAELRYLLAQDCGSCHGLTLKGGLGPALTPQALAGKAPVMLREVILHGRPGTPMPPWKPFLTADEADWLVQVLIRGDGSSARP
jgi:cytochrome c55X